MFYSLNNCKDGDTLKYDICIIGSGAAALSLASQYFRTKYRVAILECSPTQQIKTELDVDVDSNSDLFTGQVEGWIQENEPDYLLKHRRSGYGGTTSAWGGWCWPLERYDIEERSIRKGYSWPIQYNELYLYYRRAHQVCQLSAFEFDDPHYWIRQIQTKKLEVMPVDKSVLRTRVLHINPMHFGKTFFHEINTSENLDLYTNANVVGFEATQRHDGDHQLQNLVVQGTKNGNVGKMVRFEGTYFVVAAGAIESTRLLLHSQFGNQGGQLGKNFLEHPYLWVAGTFDFKTIPEGIRNFYFPIDPIATEGGNSKVIATLVPTYEYLEREGLGNFRIMFGGEEGIPGTINISSEQMPNPESQLTLSDDVPTDLFGRKRIKVQHQLLEIDLTTIKKLTEISKDTLERLDYAAGVVLSDFSQNPLSWRHPGTIKPGAHPIGTTRMSQDAADGVVDINCRVHNTGNLFVSSASVFPTGGYANPTMTIVALAIRLADHLKDKLH